MALIPASWQRCSRECRDHETDFQRDFSIIGKKVRREKSLDRQRVKLPPGNWFAPPEDMDFFNTHAC